MKTDSDRKFYLDMGRVYSNLCFARGFVVSGEWGTGLAWGQDFLWRCRMSSRGAKFSNDTSYVLFTKDTDRGLRMLPAMRGILSSGGVDCCHFPRMMTVHSLYDYSSILKSDIDYVLFVTDHGLLGDSFAMFLGGVASHIGGEGLIAVDKINLREYIRVSAADRVMIR